MHPPDFEALVEKKVSKAFISNPMCLLEPVEHLVQPINMIRISMVFKSGRTLQ